MPIIRKGSSLIELLVALPIATLLAAAAAAALIASWRLVRNNSASLGSTQELRHAQAVIEADVRPLNAEDLREVLDTAIEFNAMMGAGVVCAVRQSGRVDLMSLDPFDPRGISWASSVQPGDIIDAWTRDSASHAALLPTRTLLLDSSWGSSCAASPFAIGWADRRVVRLTIADAASSIITGAPLTVRRRTRYSLYRSGTEWFLGRRTHNGARWDVIQPVAGPFRSPAAGGMSVRALDQGGANTLSLPRAAAIRVTLRAIRRGTGNAPARTDSASFDIVLRAESAQRGG